MKNTRSISLKIIRRSYWWLLMSCFHIFLDIFYIKEIIIEEHNHKIYLNSFLFMSLFSIEILRYIKDPSLKVGNVCDDDVYFCTCYTPPRRRYNVPDFFFFSHYSVHSTYLQCCSWTDKHRLVSRSNAVRVRSAILHAQLEFPCVFRARRLATKLLSRKTCESPKKENKALFALTPLKINDS